MPLSEADLAEATQVVNLPDDPAALAAARGDALPGEPPAETAKEPAAEPAKKELTEAEKAEVDAAVAAPAKEPAKEPAKAEAEAERDPKTGQFIPKARFDELRRKKDAQIEAAENRARELEEKLKLTEGPATVQEAEAILEQKIEQHQNLLADGKLAEAKGIFKEINALNRRIARLEIQPVVQNLAHEAVRADTLEGVIDMYTSEFPEFREGSKEFDQELVNEVAELQTAFQAMGHSPAKALKKAADMVIKANQMSAASDHGAEPEKKGKASDRKAAAVKANVDVAGRQPPGLGTVGTDSDKMGASNIDVSSLSQEAFSKIDENTLKRLRGDLV